MQHQIYGLIERHHKARHIRIGDRDRHRREKLGDEQRNHRTPRAQHIAVARAADVDSGAHARRALATITFSIIALDIPMALIGIYRFVGAENHPRDAVLDRRAQDVVRSEDISLDGLHGMELAGGNLLQRRGVKDEIDAGHRVMPIPPKVANIADVIAEPLIVEPGCADLPAFSRRG